MNLAQSPLCQCGQLETVEHFLLKCPNYNIERQIMKKNLNKLGVTMNVRNILGGGLFSDNKQFKIITATANYLTGTQKINEI